MTDIQEYKERLEKDKELLKRELGKIAIKNERADGGFQAREDDFSSEPPSLDPVEIGTELESFTRNESITNELEIRYRMVEEALNRIDAGSFGLCVRCGKEIEKERLEANPSAPTCIAHMGE
ncbi:MAG: TraR/DksA family transcriptional regulator [Patescibacteria group bacterium]